MTMNSFQTNAGMTQFVPAGTGTEVTVAGSVVSLPALPDGSRGALIGIKTNAIRVTFDGTNPASAGAGFIFAAGIQYWSREMCERAKMIESAGSAAAVVRVEPGG